MPIIVSKHGQMVNCNFCPPSNCEVSVKSLELFWSYAPDKHYKIENILYVFNILYFYGIFKYRTMWQWLSTKAGHILSPGPSLKVHLTVLHNKYLGSEPCRFGENFKKFLLKSFMENKGPWVKTILSEGSQFELTLYRSITQCFITNI